MESNNDSFIFYGSWWEILEDERKEVQWEVISAVMEYVFHGNLVELKPNSAMAFKFIKRDIDRAKANRADFLNKQRENGKKGGRPTKPKETQINPNNPTVISKTQKSLNKDVNKNVNENVNESESDFVEFDGLKFPKSHIEHSGTFISNTISLQTFMQQNKIKSLDGVKSLLMEFNKHLNVEEKTYVSNDFKEYKRHFLNWHRRVPKEAETPHKSSGKLPDGMRPAEWLS